jgi:hypothetical protein
MGPAVNSAPPSPIPNKEALSTGESMKTKLIAYLALFFSIAISQCALGGTFGGVANCSFANIPVCRPASSSGNQYTTGTTPATDGQSPTILADISGSGNNATLIGGTTAGVLRQFSNGGDGSQAKIEFNNTGYALPSGVTIGGGSPTLEGTLFFCGRPSAYGNSGFPMALGDCTFPYQVITTIPTMVNNEGGGITTFPQSEVMSPLAPTVYAVRFKGGVEMKLYVGTNHTTSVVPAFNVPNATKTGGSIGSLSTGNFWNGDYQGCAVFSQALTDAQVVQVIQYMQDMIAPGNTNVAQVLFFGDSRTAGYNATETTNYPIQRSWPWRVTRMLGGRIRPWNVAVAGQDIASQTAIVANHVGVFSADYQYRVAIAELGINNVRAGATVAQMQAAYATLISTINSGTVKPTSILMMTMAVDGNSTGPQTIIFQQVNQWLKGGGLGPGVTIIKNGDDVRLGTTSYVEPDLLHQNDAGQGVYAQNALGPLLTAIGQSPFGPHSVLINNGAVRQHNQSKTGSNGSALQN